MTERTRAMRALPADAMEPVVVIVGRPNVGKSTLFNRIVRARRAIVDDTPGVTRDRLVARARFRGRAFSCVDTGGFSADPGHHTTPVLERVRAQALTAIDDATCVICVFDGRTGLVPEDRDTVDLLRRRGRPVIFVANKLDTVQHDLWRHEFQAAGIPDVLAVSAAHGRGMDDLLEAVLATFPRPDGAPAAESDSAMVRLALIGRPNVGKSSLLNRLVGEERTIVAAEAGTTRDPIDVPLTLAGQAYELIDTAGIRRRNRVRETLEGHGAVRALGMLDRSDLVLLVLDATEGMTEQDARLAGRAWAAGRGVILVANKWDLVTGARRDTTRFRDEILGANPAFATLPLLCVSARTGEGLSALGPILGRVRCAYEAALPTPKLNRVLRAAVAAHAPALRGAGRPTRLLYVTQTGRRPPIVTIFAGAPATPLDKSYVRYLTTRITTAFGIVGVPLQLLVRTAPRPGAPARAAAARGRGRSSDRPRHARPRSR